MLTVADDTDESLPDGIFEAKRRTLTAKQQATYVRSSGAIPKTRVLLEATFPHVRELTISPPVLGTHTTFYISNAPLRRFHRPSPLLLGIHGLARRLFKHASA